MKILTLLSLVFSFNFLAVAGYSPPQADAIAEVISEAGFLRARADQARSDVKSLQVNYERYLELCKKKAAPEIKVQESLWNLRKTQALVQSLDSLVKIKELDIEINSLVNPKASELDSLFKARTKERLKAVQAEYLRAQADEQYYKFEFTGYEKLLPVGAVSKAQHEHSKYDLEGAQRAIMHLQKAVQDIEKLVSLD